MVLPGTHDRPADFGRYRLMSVLGEGRMERVYRAERSGPMGFATEVALRIVKRKAGERSDLVSLLTREGGWPGSGAGCAGSRRESLRLDTGLLEVVEQIWARTQDGARDGWEGL